MPPPAARAPEPLPTQPASPYQIDPRVDPRYALLQSEDQQALANPYYLGGEFSPTSDQPFSPPARTAQLPNPLQYGQVNPFPSMPLNFPQSLSQLFPVYPGLVHYPHQNLPGNYAPGLQVAGDGQEREYGEDQVHEVHALNGLAIPGYYPAWEGQQQ